MAKKAQPSSATKDQTPIRGPLDWIRHHYGKKWAMTWAFTMIAWSGSMREMYAKALTQGVIQENKEAVVRMVLGHDYDIEYQKGTDRDIDALVGRSNNKAELRENMQEAFGPALTMEEKVDIRKSNPESQTFEKAYMAYRESVIGTDKQKYKVKVKAASGSAVMNGQTLVAPIAGEMRITDHYHAKRSGGRKHKGIDLNPRSRRNNTSQNTPIRAVLGGTVTAKSIHRGVSRIDITSGRITNVYLHVVPASDLRVGQFVEQGAEFSKIAPRDRVSSGSHLHWGIKVDGKYIDPTPYVQQMMNQQKQIKLDGIQGGGTHTTYVEKTREVPKYEARKIGTVVTSVIRNNPSIKTMEELQQKIIEAYNGKKTEVMNAILKTVSQKISDIENRVVTEDIKSDEAYWAQSLNEMGSADFDSGSDVLRASGNSYTTLMIVQSTQDEEGKYPPPPLTDKYYYRRLKGRAKNGDLIAMEDAFAAFVRNRAEVTDPIALHNLVKGSFAAKRQGQTKFDWTLTP